MANTTWNPSDKSAGITLTGGNLIATNSSGGSFGGRAADRQASGKYYWEVALTTIINSSSGVGVSLGNASINFPGTSYAGACALLKTGTVWLNSSTNLTGFGVLVSGNLVCVALDLDNRRVWFRVGAAGNWNVNASYNPATNSGGIDVSSLLGGAFAAYPCYGSNGLNDQYTANFGDTAFVGAVPAGFTSGFTAGASPATNALATQVATEEWFSTSAPAQVTQVAVEEWINANKDTIAQLTQLALEEWGGEASAQLTQLALEQWVSGSLSTQALLTQLALEQWASLPPSAVTATAGQTAVTIVT